MASANPKIKQLTVHEKDLLEQELTNLIQEKRPEIIRQLQEAREQGDLSENADYDAAKAAQGEIEKRINELQYELDHSIVVTDDHIDKNVVGVGCQVTVYDLERKIEKTWKIGSIQVDPRNHMISVDSPLVKAILGEKVGTIKEVKGIDNPYRVEIKKIKY